MYRPIIRVLSTITALAAVGLSVAPASASAPTRIVDKTVNIVCEATAGNIEVVVGVGRSDLAGTDARAEVSIDNETVGFGYTTSDWTGSSFRSAIALTNHDDEPTGEVYFAGSYQPDSEPVTTESKFKDGNVNVVQRHTETLLALSDLTLVYNGQEFQPDRCDASQTDGYLSFTNPNIQIGRGSYLGYECTSTNGIGLPFVDSAGGVDELYVEVQLDDEPDINARGVVAAASGSWSGSLRVSENDEEAGTVGAVATLVQQARTHSKGAEGEHFKVTPYAFTLDIAGGSGWAPNTVQCTLYDVSVRLHFPNPAA